MTIIQTNKELQPRKEFDFYPTPRELCSSIYRECAILLWNPYLKVLDAGAGDGVWGQEFRKFSPLSIITGVELRDLNKPDGYDNWHRSTDFMSFDEGEYDVVLGNPPYKYAEEFVWKGLELINISGYVIYLLPLSFLESKKRYNSLFMGHAPFTVLVSTRRVSFTGNKKSDNTAYAVYIWSKQKRKDSILSWLDWSYD